MTTRTPDAALADVRAAATALNLALMSGHVTHLGQLCPALELLADTVGAVRTLAELHPEAELDRPVPPGALPVTEVSVVDQLELAASIPTEPARVILRAGSAGAGCDTEAALRDFLNGRHLTVTPTREPRTYQVGVERLADEIAARFLPL